MLRFAMMLAATFLMVVSSHAVRAAELIVVERDDCHWCKVFDREVGNTYHQTPVGRIVPLRRVDLYAAKPADLAHISLGRFTPTFILMDQGREIVRLRGYGGKRVFWQMLKKFLQELPSVRDQGVLEKTDYSSSRK